MTKMVHDFDEIWNDEDDRLVSNSYIYKRQFYFLLYLHFFLSLLNLNNFMFINDVFLFDKNVS